MGRTILKLDNGRVTEVRTEETANRPPTQSSSTNGLPPSSSSGKEATASGGAATVGDALPMPTDERLRDAASAVTDSFFLRYFLGEGGLSCGATAKTSTNEDRFRAMCMDDLIADGEKVTLEYLEWTRKDDSGV